MSNIFDADEVFLWTPEEVRDFLKNNHTTSYVADALYGEGLNGQMLLEFTKKEYKELDEVPKMKTADIVLLLKLKEDYIQGKMEKVVTVKPETKKAERQPTRPFNTPSNTYNKYKLGNFISAESGASSLDDPAREFKLFSLNGENVTLEKVEETFVDKVAKFAAACLNSRINGTIYFGVADTKDGEYKHGEIVGMNVKEEEAYLLEEWIEKHLRGTNQKHLGGCKDEEKKAFSRCISPVKIVQIENSCRIIAEIDIRPDADTCKYLVFPIRFPFSNDSKTDKYFQREGTSSYQGEITCIKSSRIRAVILLSPISPISPLSFLSPLIGHPHPPPQAPQPSQPPQPPYP